MLKKIFFSRYLHLCLTVLALYGVTRYITYTTEFEKIINRLRRYCYADYEVRASKTSMMRLKAEFTRDQFAEQLRSFSADIFDYRNEEQVMSYFSSKNYFYDVSKTDEGNSYLLAQITRSGQHEEQIPETVSFRYAILGEEEIMPFSVYQEGPWRSLFISEKKGMIYIHTATLDSFLRWCFAILWKLEPRTQKDFDIDDATHFLYLDLPVVCQEVFIERQFVDEETSRKYFLEKAFESLLPTMLAMGARMMADKETSFSARYKYERAYLTGLAMRPQGTLFNYLATYGFCNTLTRSLAAAVSIRLKIMNTREITREIISQTAQNIFAERQDSALRDLIEDNRELPGYCHQ